MSLDGDRPSATVEGRLDGAVLVGAQDASTGGGEPLEGLRGGMPVRVVGPHRGDADGRAHGVDERLTGGRTAAVVGDLHEVDARQTAFDEPRVDVVLDVSGQEEAA